MKIKIFFVLFFFFWVVSMPFVAYGNTNKKYFEELKKLAIKERANKNFIKASKLIEEIEKAAEENNWIDLKIDAYNNKGVIYKDLFDYGKAVDCYLSAYEMALKQSDKKRELSILNNIAEAYHLNHEHLKAREYLDKSYKIASYLKDSLRMGQLSSNLATIIQTTGDIDLAETYIDLSLKILSDYKDTPEYLVSQIVKMDNLYLQKKYNEAEQMGLSIWNQRHRIDYLFRSYFILALSKIYHKKGNITKAIDYAHEALQEKPSLQECIDIYDLLSDLHQLDGAYLLALQYKDSVIMTVDSLHKINNKDYLESNLIRFELINSERELTENKAKQKAERLLFIVIIIFIVFLAFIVFWLLRVQYIRNKQRKIIAENNQKIMELELKEEKNEKLLLKQQLNEQEALSTLKQERFNNEIELKNNQLVAKALFQSDRNKLVKEIVDALSQIPNYSENLILNSTIRKLKTQLKDSVELDNFLVDFQQINPDLFTLLKNKHPYLNADDIHLLFYTYLYIDAKKIAHLLNISPDAYRKRKERLAKKINIETTDLHNYLIDIIKLSINK